jgi:hypothetical protein
MLALSQASKVPGQPSRLLPRVGISRRDCTETDVLVQSGMAQAKKIGSKKAQNRTEAVIGYMRVSTDQQAESGAGMAAQRSAIRRQCEQHGWELAAIYEDNGASAKSLNGRSGLSEALEVLAGGDAAALVVAKLDRLARSVHDFAGLVRKAE